MADPDVALKGLLERNTEGIGHTTGYRLNNVTIEVDLSKVEAVDESLEGMPITLRGHFEIREHPEHGARWIFKAHSAEPGAFAEGGGMSSAPPPSA